MMHLCADVGSLGFGAGLTSILAALAGLVPCAFSDGFAPAVSMQCVVYSHCVPPVLQIAQANEPNGQH